MEKRISRNNYVFDGKYWYKVKLVRERGVFAFNIAKSGKGSYIPNSVIKDISKRRPDKCK